MLVFITSLRHPKNSKDYQNIELLLMRTLQSVCAQTDTDFYVIVVCNQLPANFPDLPNVCFVQVDFPPPSAINNAQTGMPALQKDKGTKYLIGLKKAEEFKPDYVMFFDADDYVHQDIAKYVNANLGENGWYIDKGLVYRDGGLLISKTDNFNQVCGTSNIFNFDLLRQTMPYNLDASQDSLLGLVDNEFIFTILGGHRKVPAWFAERGHALKAFPFAAAIWLTNTGENHSGVNFFGMPHLLSSELATSFNINPPKALAVWLKDVLLLYPYYCVRALLRYLKHALLK
jgi:glycosyltransferase involved in cell wall biosynthesis